MCTGCLNPVVAFSWVGFLLINGSVISLISWGTAQFWPVGLVLAILYAVGIFYIVDRLRKKKDSSKLIIDLLLLLGVAAVGASGVILAFNIVLESCGLRDQYTGTVSSADWIFPDEAAQGSAEVTAWAAQNRWDSGSVATFVYEPSTSNLLFRGRAANANSETLWLSSGGGTAPAEVDADLTNPRSVVAVQQRACFVAYDERHDDYPDRTDKVFCCAADGASLSTVLSADGGPIRSPSALLVANARLYFKADAPNGDYVEAGVVYASDAPFTRATRLSVPTGGGGTNSSSAGGVTEPPCEDEDAFRFMATLMLLLATLPTLALALFLWRKTRAPSMNVATFGAVSALALNIYALIEPSGESAADVIQWWFFGFGALWLLLHNALRLQNRVGNGTYRWAMDVGCIAYVSAAFVIVQVPLTPDAWRWVLFQLVVLLPMGLVALIAARTTAGLPLFLTSVCLLIDAWKLTAELTGLVDDPTLATFVGFLVLGLVGAGVVTLGILYNSQQQAIGRAVDGFAERACGPCLKPKIADQWPADGAAPATASKVIV